MSSDRWARRVSEPRRKGGGSTRLHGLGRGWAGPRRKGVRAYTREEGKGRGRQARPKRTKAKRERKE